MSSGFLKRQFRQVREGGWHVLLHKAGILLLMPAALSAVLFARLLRPFILIRFGPFRGDRIGHLVFNIEIYLCERDAGPYGRRIMDFFYFTLPIANQQLSKMWKRKLPIFGFVKYLDRISRHLPAARKHMPLSCLYTDRDLHNFMERTPAHIVFTAEEEQLGRAESQRIGIPEGAPYICFHARDSRYLKTVMPDKDFNYHNHRDSDINNYIPAAEDLTGRGYFAVRMGAFVEKPLNCNNPKIIDYAFKDRSDFLDIYLCAKCRFFLDSSSGIACVAMVFRRPVVWTNFVSLQLMVTWNSYDLIIPKKLWLVKEKRFLTFREIMDSQVNMFCHNEEFEKAGIESIENTPEEIISVASEMEQRLRGSWNPAQEDQQLQERFWSMFKPAKLYGYQLHGKIKARIGAEFLRQNRDLLE